VSLVSSDERTQLKDIERLLGRPIQRAQLPSISDPPARPNRPAAAPSSDADGRRPGHRGQGGPRNGNANGHNQRQHRGGTATRSFAPRRSSGR
jgi:hypothetical protein